VTGETIASIRARAEVARHLADENKQPDAKAALVQMAAMLDADADRLETAGGHDPRPGDRP
jgi:hypothetical protein